MDGRARGDGIMLKYARSARHGLDVLLGTLRAPSKVSSVANTFLIRIVLLVVTFGTGIIVARTLAPTGRGEQAALALWPIFIAGLSTLGIPIALSYQSRRHPEDAGRLLFAAAAIVVALGCCSAGIGVALMPHLLHGYDARLVRNAQWFMVFTPQCLLVYVLRSHLEARGEYLRSILGQLVPTIFVLATLVVLRQTHSLTPSSAALAYFCPSAVQTVWLVYRIRARFELRPASFFRDVSAVLGYGLRCYGTDVINALSSQLDLAIIVAFLNPTALGLYSVSLTLARLLNIVQQSLLPVLFPHASGLEPNAAIPIIARACRISTAFSVVLGVMLVLAMPIALPFVYGAAFGAATAIVPLLAAEAIVGGLATILSLAFSACGRPVVVTVIQGMWLACALVLLLILVPRMHVSGAAVALLGAALMRLAFMVLAYRFVLQRDFPKLIIDRSDIAYLREKIFARRERAEHRSSTIMTRPA